MRSRWGQDVPSLLGCTRPTLKQEDALALLSRPVRDWFAGRFPDGPTPAQSLAWPRIAAGEHVLLVSPTGTGKTLAAFLAILDRLFRAHAGDARARAALRLRLAAAEPQLRHRAQPGRAAGGDPHAARAVTRSPVRVGVRTGDTSAYERRKLRDDPPHLLITTPESLSLLLSQAGWHAHWRGRRAPDRRRGPRPGADQARGRPGRLARAAGGAGRARSLPRRPVGDLPPGRAGRAVPGRAVADLPGPRGARCRRARRPWSSRSRALIRARRGAAPRPELPPLLRRLARDHRRNRTTVVFANTRPFAEKLTHDLRPAPERWPCRASRTARRWPSELVIAAHHSALDAQRAGASRVGGSRRASSGRW